jgi:hypothetical protein
VKTTVLAAIAVAALAIATDADAAKWKQLAKNKSAELWIDQASIKRNDGDTAFDYRIDYAKPQKDRVTGTPYRSSVMNATVRCQARTMSQGPSTAYAGKRGKGKVVGRYLPLAEEARFQPVEAGSSDENLWRHICDVAQVQPKK